ncbi:MAG: hypothetical protein ABIO49_00090 [Dokdonella sp.]
MNEFGVQRLATLAATLGISPRHLLVAVARLARDDVEDNPVRRQRVLADARAARRAAEGAAALLATPIASFAPDELDRALASLWPARSETVG